LDDLLALVGQVVNEPVHWSINALTQLLTGTCPVIFI
jgi:hypothetical protein